VDQSKYLEWLTKKLSQTNRVRFEERKVISLQEERSKFCIVINWTGLGAAALVPNANLYPPWITSYYNFGPINGHPGYIIPNVDSVVVGGTCEENNASLAVERKTTFEILECAKILFPSLVDAPVMAEWVGLRPASDSIQLECDESRKGFIIHCFGHGGAGVTLAMGCAEDIVNQYVASAIIKLRDRKL